MDILIPDSWLRDYIETDISAPKLAEYLSLCGPAVERIHKEGQDFVYAIEVTTNRVDMASVRGIAREAAAILPRFGVKMKYKSQQFNKISSQKEIPIEIISNKNHAKRFLAILLTDVKVADSPAFIKDRLNKVGQRSLNNAIDITNYVMFELGTPLHAFDYDKISSKKIIVREAKKGEAFQTLDGVKRTTKGGEIVFDDGHGQIIDLPSVMGTENTKVTDSTKNILLVSESIDPLKIRKTSLVHELRTHAAALNEKNVDPESLLDGILYATSLFTKYSDAKISSKLFDWYPEPVKVKPVTTTIDFLKNLLGIALTQKSVTEILTSLNFKVVFEGEKMIVTAPSYRSHEMNIPEDIAEEVARIYGYFNFPSQLPSGKLPAEEKDAQIEFEEKLRVTLTGFGATEVYTQSFVSKEMVLGDALKLKNPLGSDGEYLRTRLSPSLLQAAKSNTQEKMPFHLFEIAHIYTPVKGKLPQEVMQLCGIFGNTEFRKAKGVIEALFEVLGITTPVNIQKFDNYWIYEYPVSTLLTQARAYKRYEEISKFPPQIEDITVQMKPETRTATVISAIKQSSKNVSLVELKDTYENSYTFRINYHDSKKTLTDSEVEVLRGKVLKAIKELGLIIS